jgi:hypothetical protein
MGDEKIFKDLTKKYADLAKKIHSKDKRSASLIKDCSKRIALLDKLRVLEVSYLKCLKNKVKRGQKGGDEKEEKKEGNQVVSNEEDVLIEEATNELEETELKEITEPSVNDNNQRALALCTTALVKTLDLKEKATIFIEDNKEAILKKYENIDIEQKKAILREESKKLAKLASSILKDKTGIDADVALKTAYNTGMGLKDEFNTQVLPTLIGVKDMAKEGATNVYSTGKKIGEFAYFNIRKRLVSQPPAQPPAQASTQASTGGGKKTTYRLNGEKVVLLHKNKKVQRSIYVKGNGKTKYCKIDKEYVLLSKVKNKIQ